MNMNEETKQKLIEAVMTLKEYCESQCCGKGGSCDNCFFERENFDDFCFFSYSTSPCNWLVERSWKKK